jgi:hypothetical protein
MASIESDLADLHTRPAWHESGAAEVEERQTLKFKARQAAQMCAAMLCRQGQGRLLAA